jgi:hypothetical protein
MNPKIKIIPRSICSAIVASVFLVIAGLATAEDTKSKSKSPEPLTNKSSASLNGTMKHRTIIADHFVIAVWSAKEAECAEWSPGR